jgi:hypothetical protein
MAIYVALLCEVMSITDVAKLTVLDWKTIKNIDISSILKHLPDIETLSIKCIAIDEIAIMKGYKYLSIIRDYDTGITLKIVIENFA